MTRNTGTEPLILRASSPSPTSPWAPTSSQAS